MPGRQAVSSEMEVSSALSVLTGCEQLSSPEKVFCLEMLLLLLLLLLDASAAPRETLPK